MQYKTKKETKKVIKNSKYKLDSYFEKIQKKYRK